MSPVGLGPSPNWYVASSPLDLVQTFQQASRRTGHQCDAMRASLRRHLHATRHTHEQCRVPMYRVTHAVKTAARLLLSHTDGYNPLGICFAGFLVAKRCNWRTSLHGAG